MSGTAGPPYSASPSRLVFLLAALLVSASLGYWSGRHALRGVRTAVDSDAPAPTGIPAPFVTAPAQAAALQDAGALGLSALPALPSPARVEEDPAAFTLSAASPLRVTWPLDVGPEPGGTVRCLRARQGANEIQYPGEGRALYVFRVPRAGRYHSWLRVLWQDDGVGSPDCNNSWFAALDAGPTMPITENSLTHWHWERGPEAELDAGWHFFRIELREDGSFLERIALLPAGSAPPVHELEALPCRSFSGCAGLRPPHEPDQTVRDLEIAALPTASSAIGAGQRNEVTVLAAWQGGQVPFNGTIEIEAPSAPGLNVSGEQRLSCDIGAPYAWATVTLHFPVRLDRRIHPVLLRVKDAGGQEVLRRRLEFFKGPAWAFLGPFPDPSHGGEGANPLALPALAALARLADPKDLDPPAPKTLNGTPPAWRLIEDGACFDELGAVDLLKVYGKVHNGWAYAVTYLWSEEPSTGNALLHRSFSFQADDTATLWINQQLTALQPGRLPKECNRLWCSARLTAGLHPVVVKIGQAQRYWGFRFQEVDWHYQGRRGDVMRWGEPAAWPKP